MMYWCMFQPLSVGDQTLFVKTSYEAATFQIFSALMTRLTLRFGFSKAARCLNQTVGTVIFTRDVHCYFCSFYMVADMITMVQCLCCRGGAVIGRCLILVAACFRGSPFHPFITHDTLDNLLLSVSTLLLFCYPHPGLFTPPHLLALPVLCAVSVSLPFLTFVPLVFPPPSSLFAASCRHVCILAVWA